MPRVIVSRLNWLELNEWLRTATEEEALDALTQEQHGAKRQEYLRRLHSKVNVLRAERERKEINGNTE